MSRKMSRKFLILPLAAAFLAAPAVPATAQKPGDPKTNAQAINSSKSNSFKVTAVNASAGTFTGVSKGKESTFIAPKGKPLPAVGKIYDITYTESPGGGPLQATTVKKDGEVRGGLGDR